MATLPLFLDTVNRRLVLSATDTQPFTLPSLIRGDALTLVVQLLSPVGTLTRPFVVKSTTGLSLRVGVGTAGLLSNLVTLQTTWTIDATAKTFTGALPLNTPEIEAAFTVSAGAPFTRLFEIEIEEDGRRTTALQIPVTLREDVIKDGALEPEAYSPPSALADNLALLLQDSATVDVTRNGDEFTFNASPVLPLSHATSHASAGSDAITPGSIGAATAGHAHASAVPVGGSAGQVLTKTTATNYDAGWQTPSGGGGETNTASNVGTGGGQIFKAKTGVDLELRTITAGAGISVGTSGNEISIASTGSGPSMTVGNIGSGNGVYYGVNPTTLVVELKSLAAGNGFTITDDYAGTLTLSNSVTGAGGVGSGNSIFYGNNATTLEFKSLLAGNGFTITDDYAGNLTLAPAVQGAENIGQNWAGEMDIYSGNPAGQLQFKRLGASDGIVITDDGAGKLNIGMPTVGNSTKNVECKNFRVFSQATSESGVIDMDAGSIQYFGGTGSAIAFSTVNADAGKITTLLVTGAGVDAALSFDASWVFFGTKPATLPASKRLLLNLTCVDASTIIASAIVSE